MTDVGGDGAFEPWPDADVHVEWGVPGAALAARRGDIVIVVDVLSFSTTVSIAVERGAELLALTPADLVRRGGPQAAARVFAARVAGRRGDPHAYFTLSPASLGRVQPGDRLVLTSLNGATVTRAASGYGAAAAVYTGCLRDRAAVAEAAGAEASKRDRARITVVPAGELWSAAAGSEARHDGLPAAIVTAVRPGIEDWLVAGAIVERLATLGLRVSAEAAAAAATWRAAGSQAGAWIRASVSGRELEARGFAADLAPAVELDVAPTAARRGDDGWYRAAR